MPKYDGHRIEHMTTWNRGWEETHREELRADEIRQWSCTLTKMFNTDAQNLPSKRLEEPAQMHYNKKHPEQVKTDLTNLKVFWTFRRLDCTNSKGFSRVKKLKKISTCVTPRYLHRQYSKAYTPSHQFTSLDSSIYWTLAMNDCYCRRSSRTHPTKPRHRSLFC